MSVSHETEQTVFDIAVNSLDFASGFLDNSEVEHLRAYAIHLGVDPEKATPREFICHYDNNRHQWQDWKPLSWPTNHGDTHSRYCTRCGNFEYKTEPLAHLDPA